MDTRRDVRKVVDKEPSVHRGAHEDEAQVRALWEQVAEDREEEVRVDVALVDFVDNDVRDLPSVSSLVSPSVCQISHVL